MGIKRERLERRRSTAGGMGKMKDAGGGQQKRDDAGDAEEEWRDRRGEAGWQRDASQRGQPELMELIFPFSGTAHQNSFHPLAQGKDLPLPGQGGSRSWRGDRSPQCLPSSLLHSGWLCPALPCLALVHQGCLPKTPAQWGPSRVPGSPGAAGEQGALEHLDPRQPLMHHQVAQGKSPCSIKIHPNSL